MPGKFCFPDILGISKYNVDKIEAYLFFRTGLIGGGLGLCRAAQEHVGIDQSGHPQYPDHDDHDQDAF